MKNTLKNLTRLFLKQNQRAFPIGDQTSVESRYEILREWRNQKALIAGVRRYRILSNQTLKNLAEANPCDITTLQDVRGIGPKTIERFAAEILRELGHVKEIRHSKDGREVETPVSR